LTGVKILYTDDAITINPQNKRTNILSSTDTITATPEETINKSEVAANNASLMPIPAGVIEISRLRLVLAERTKDIAKSTGSPVSVSNT